MLHINDKVRVRVSEIECVTVDPVGVGMKSKEWFPCDRFTGDELEAFVEGWEPVPE